MVRGCRVPRITNEEGALSIIDCHIQDDHNKNIIETEDFLNLQK